MTKRYQYSIKIFITASFPWKTEIFFHCKQDASNIYTGVPAVSYDLLPSRVHRFQECLKLCLATQTKQIAHNLNILFCMYSIKLRQFLLLDVLNDYHV